MQICVTLSESDLKKLSVFAEERKYSLSNAIRYLSISAIEKINQIEAK